MNGILIRWGHFPKCLKYCALASSLLAVFVNDRLSNQVRTEFFSLFSGSSAPLPCALVNDGCFPGWVFFFLNLATALRQALPDRLPSNIVVLTQVGCWREPILLFLSSHEGFQMK